MGQGFSGMKYIELTKNKRVLVDDEDYAYLSSKKWYYGANGYAAREEKDKTVLMHRVIIDAPQGMDVDHINRDKLDNRRQNLRIATRSQNKANMVTRKRHKQQLPMGISYNPSPRSKQPYMARVGKDGKAYFVGNLYKLEDAVAAYTAKKRELYGEYAAA